MTQIGKYDIVRRTGQTPLGTVYEAVDRETRRTVAIQATEETCSESVGRLNHPNIRNLIAVEQADGGIFLVLEHLNARPILEYASNPELPPAELMQLLKAAAIALDHANAGGVAHPGLTPAHLLVNADGLLKVAGFELPGLDTLADALAYPSTNRPERSDAEREALERSVPYLAPEFLSGDYDTAHGHQFSLAAIAYEVFTGTRLFASPSVFSAMAGILQGHSSDLALVESKTSAAVRRVLERMLAPDPASRYSSCTAAIDSLQLVTLRKPAAETRVTDTPPPTPVSAPMPVAPPLPQRIANVKRENAKRLRWVVAATVVTALAMAGLILSQLMHSKPPEPRKRPVLVSTPAPPPEKPVTPVVASTATSQAPPSVPAPKPPRRKTNANQKPAIQMVERPLDQ